MTDLKQPETEPFRTLAESQPKNRGAQLLIIGVLIVTILGGFLAVGGLVLGFVLLIGGLMALIALLVWAIRHWEWSR